MGGTVARTRRAVVFSSRRVARLTLSARAYDPRSQGRAKPSPILDGADSVDADHIAEALQFRMI